VLVVQRRAYLGGVADSGKTRPALFSFLHSFHITTSCPILTMFLIFTYIILVVM
jgi:hypothetical protein